MMESKEVTPTGLLDEAHALPEFLGATLTLGELTQANTESSKDNRAHNDAERSLDLQHRTNYGVTNDRAKYTSVNSDRPIHRSSTESSEISFPPSHLASGLATAEGYFSSRDSLLQRAMSECRFITNDRIIGSWLLTLVDHWDNEKERILLLCAESLLIVKYDFIALTIINHQCIGLRDISALTIGNLEYPDRSITPQVQHLATRFSELLRHFTPETQENTTREQSTRRPNENQSSPVSHQLNRQRREGTRVSWSKTLEPNLTHQLWNPFSKDIPWITVVSHPLLESKVEQRLAKLYDVQDFIANLRNTLQASTMDRAHFFVEYKPIIMESYIGLPALVHNYSQLGFYKVRGKISF